MEQKKTVLVQESPKVATKMPFFKAFNGTKKSDTLVEDAKGKKKEMKKKASSAAQSDEDVGMRIITIAGENKGAIMELGKSSSTPTGWTIHKHHHTSSDLKAGAGSDSSSSGGEEGKGKGSHKKKEKCDKSNKKGMEMPMKAFMNSNVQGVNNSILYDTCVSHHDPGVHLSLTRKPAKGTGHGFGFGFKHHGHDDHGHHTN